MTIGTYAGNVVTRDAKLFDRVRDGLALVLLLKFRPRVGPVVIGGHRNRSARGDAVGLQLELNRRGTRAARVVTIDPDLGRRDGRLTRSIGVRDGEVVCSVFGSLGRVVVD